MLTRGRITRYLGCYTAYGVFVWRYVNAPQNWAYVNSFWSWFIILFTLFPETVYPFVYLWAHVQSGKRSDTMLKGRVEVTANGTARRAVNGKIKSS